MFQPTVLFYFSFTGHLSVYGISIQCHCVVSCWRLSSVTVLQVTLEQPKKDDFISSANGRVYLCRNSVSSLFFLIFLARFTMLLIFSVFILCNRKKIHCLSCACARKRSVLATPKWCSYVIVVGMLIDKIQDTSKYLIDEIESWQLIIS